MKTAESSANGLRERDFTVAGVPGVLWSPLSCGERAPLILMGHGGGNHTKRWTVPCGSSHGTSAKR